jgi:hypothetical protein
MPCYEPPPDKETIRAWQKQAIDRGDYQYALRLTPIAFEQLLCDAMGLMTPAQIEAMPAIAIGWLEQHKRQEKK